MITDADVLIADDDDNVRFMLKKMLEKEGFRVYSAENGEAAVAIARDRDIQAAVLDIQMPKMNGISALQEIKRIDPGIEVLIITGNANLDSLRMTLVENGAFDYILKPFHRKELVHAVQNALMKRAYLHKERPAPGEPSQRLARLEADLGERTRQLRESQIKYREIVESSSDGIFVYQEGRLRFVNENMTEMTGRTRADLLARPFSELLAETDRKPVTDSVEALQRETDRVPTLCRYRLIRKTGETVWVETGNRRTLWENRPAVLVFCRDITEQVRAERLLQEAREDLERRVAQRTAELRRTNRRLKREIAERMAAEANLTELLRKQEINISLAKAILNLINGPPPRHIPLPEDRALFVDALSIPCLTEGGDHFFVRTSSGSTHSDDRTLISLKDQSGHAVNCILRSIATDLIHQTIIHRENPLPIQETLALLNERIGRTAMFEIDDFVTALTAEIHHESLTLWYVSNGHPPFLLIRGTSVSLISDLDAPGTNVPLAWVGCPAYRAADLRLAEGDRLILFTDGLNEMPHARHNRVLSYAEVADRVVAIVAADPAMPVSEIIVTLHRRISDIRGTATGETVPSGDDVTLLGIEVEPTRPEGEDRLCPAGDEEVAEWVSTLYTVIADQWAQRGFSEPEHRLYLAIEETVWNAFKHGNQRSPEKRITVQWRFGNDFHLTVIDEGEGFDPDTIPDPTVGEYLTRQKGRGIFFLRHFSSDLSWADEGRTIQVAMPRQPRPADAAAPGSGQDLWEPV